MLKTNKSQNCLMKMFHRSSCSVGMRMLLFFVVVSMVNAQDECYLKCPDGLQCVIGQVNHPSSLFNTTTSSSSSTDTWTGMHCACPEGLTGLMCEVPYESCGQSGGGHKCYNNGECVPGQTDYFGNDQFYCDCTNAVDAEQGLSYVGKYCEKAVISLPSTTTTTTTTTANDGESTSTSTTGTDTDSTTTATSDPVSCQEDPTGFCLNEGKCNAQYPDFGSPCLCPSGFSGQRCEYTEGTVPNCTLPCANGGTCVLGPIQDKVFEAFWKDVVVNPDNNGNNDLDYMHCDCTDDYDGPLCTIQRQPCGTDPRNGKTNYCYYGSQCESNYDTVTGTATQQCNCDAANTAATSYAGRFCQYEAQVYCKKNANINEHLFCTNDGTCRTGDQIQDGCICPTGYEGMSCEYVSGELNATSSTNTLNTTSTTTEVNEGSGFSGSTGDSGSTASNDNTTTGECNIKCLNGGVCRSGVKDVSSKLGQVIQDTQHLFFDSSNETFNHCVCSGPWTGALCDVPVETCCDDKHVCLHGGKCVAKGDEQLCDCDEVDSDMASYFAGQHCEHPINDICSIDPDPMQGLPLSFCVNGGICKSRVQAGQPHPGCYCEAGFIGPHCELRESVHPLSSDLPQSWTSDDAAKRTSEYNEQKKNGKSPGKIVGLVFGILAALLVAFLAIRLIYRRKRRHNSLNSTVMWADKYQDNPSPDDDEQNIAPRRRDSPLTDLAASSKSLNAFTTDKSTSSHSYESSRDPMATHLAPKSLITSRSNENSPTRVSDSDDDDDDHYNKEFRHDEKDGILKSKEAERSPQIYIGPPRDEDGHVLHNVDIV